MQLTNFLAVLTLTAVGAMAAPGAPTRNRPTPNRPQRPSKPAPPVINQQVNYCSSGDPYCCSPTNDNGGSGGGTTCKKSNTQCQSISICCNNAQNGDGTATQTCSATSSLKQPVQFVFD
ncbi:hypothetical protein SVAN01_01544 [Stagonosporopsis vannaccii]|nr:hypothetical protein SVAN01_01544 [Stagonosporopsis vannaccii]